MMHVYLAFEFVHAAPTNSDTVPRPIHAHTTLRPFLSRFPAPLCSARSASSAQDVYYQYPDMGVCLHVGFGCDDFFLTEACAQSSNTTEGGSRNGTFIFGWVSEQQQVSATVEKSVDGVSVKRWKLGRRRLECGPHRISCARDRPSHHIACASVFRVEIGPLMDTNRALLRLFTTRNFQRVIHHHGLRNSDCCSTF